MKQAYTKPRSLLIPAPVFSLVNFFVFQIIWLLCVFLGNSHLSICVALIGSHFLCSPTPLADFKTLLMVSSLGFLCDTALTFLGVFVFSTTHPPAWLFVIWSAFALALRHSLSWMLKIPVVIQALLGAIGGTSSYLAGFHLKAVHLPIGWFSSGILLLVVWGLLFPTFLKLAHRYE